MNTVLFDLDGTVLPMDMKEFLDTYIKLLKDYVASSGYDGEAVIKSVWAGFYAVVKNDGMLTNEELFWKVFMETIKETYPDADNKFKRKMEKTCNKFYSSTFSMVRYITKPSQDCFDAIMMLKEKGYNLVLATAPVFPQVATYERLSWTGLRPEDFSYITTYENCCYTKPNLKYYEHLLKVIDKDPGDCLMVGNDVKEDMCASELGIDVFLLDEYILNDDNLSIEPYKSGNWSLFKEYVSNLPVIN